ncbi:MAG: tRNA pseudouridine(38-40) synthase TruA [Candidatus Omnitrophota bacterium]
MTDFPARTFRVLLEYDGTHFNGWQVQPGDTRTVQGEIESALRRIFQKKIRLYGSGRTDSGVHARGQTAHFQVKTGMSCNNLVRAINGNLPEDAAVLTIQEAADGFHAQYSAKRKTYSYTICNRPEPPVLQRHFCLHVPVHLNAAVMAREAAVLIGRHDFRSFMAADPAFRKTGREKDAIRWIYDITVRRNKEMIVISVTANGFLYKMVRNIVGTLLAAGAGRIPEGSMKKILRSQDRSRAGDTAPPHGLCLERVEYGC